MYNKGKKLTHGRVYYHLYQQLANKNTSSVLHELELQSTKNFSSNKKLSQVVGIAIIHEFLIFHSMTKPCLFHFQRLNKSNDISVLLSGTSPTQTFFCHNVSSPLLSDPRQTNIRRQISLFIETNEIIAATAQNK